MPGPERNIGTKMTASAINTTAPSRRCFKRQIHSGCPREVARDYTRPNCLIGTAIRRQRVTKPRSSANVSAAAATKNEPNATTRSPTAASCEGRGERVRDVVVHAGDRNACHADRRATLGRKSARRIVREPAEMPGIDGGGERLDDAANVLVVERAEHGNRASARGMRVEPAREHARGLRIVRDVDDELGAPSRNAAGAHRRVPA